MPRPFFGCGRRSATPPVLLGVVLGDGEPSHLLDELFEWIAHGSNSGRRRDAGCMRASTRPSLVVKGRVALERATVPRNERMNCGWSITVRTLNIRDQSPLRAGVAVDVAFGGFDRSMPREQLHVAQAAAGAMDVAGRDRDEAAPPGMR